MCLCSRCVANQCPLLDSGTLGTKGHVEVVIPHLTESYNSQRDPPEEEIPFCTLKSFPAVIEHTIQWARDKFESSFAHKPATFSTFWEKQQDPHQVLRDLQAGRVHDSCVQAIKFLGRRPCTWDDCVVQARLKFEKYFNHKVRVVHSFSSLFWQSPKRPPTPQTFEPSDELENEETNVLFFFVPRYFLESRPKELLRMTPLIFEKDCDANAHVDFVTAVSNLRARMYGIESASRLETKRIAGRIIPAIATTTATVSGLVALEMVKVVQGAALGAFKNCFLNLALPIMLFSEFVEGYMQNLNFLVDLTFQVQYGVEPTMVVQGVKMIYVPVMPGHSKRLKQTMNKLLKQTERQYVDLTLSFAPESPDHDDLPGPPVRYFLR
uniref:Ubiquitin-activating enzyme E1 C-terminal domain-containing protein n=1 Tax=Eptatretus burgeri TaxID=7764 RepID=A0A8C4Q4I3_EPTBU